MMSPMLIGRPTLLGSLSLIAVLAACGSTRTAATFNNVAPAAGRAAPPSASAPSSSAMTGLVAGALSNGDAEAAVRLAQLGVMAAPQDAAALVALGQAYVAAGRFMDALTPLAQAGAIDAANPRIQVTLALAHLGSGDVTRAMPLLAGLEPLAASDPALAADVGLALALSGEHRRSLMVLEAAVRDPRATVRTRQNLALSYALANDWARARAMAAVDLIGQDVSGRLQQWAALAAARPGDRLATLMGVVPAGDSPMLAAAAPQAPALLTAAAPQAPALLAKPAEIARSAEVAQAAAPVAAVATAVAVPAEVPAPVVAVAVEPTTVAVAAVAAEPVAPVAAKPAFVPSPPKLIARNDAASAPATVKVNLVAATPAAVEPRPAPPPVATPHPPVSMKVAVSGPVTAKAPAGGWTVQLAAYRHEASFTWGWRSLRNAHPATLATYEPTLTAAGASGLRRLVVGEFSSRKQAYRLCAALRQEGGSCFVRHMPAEPATQMVSRAPDATAL